MLSRHATTRIAVMNIPDISRAVAARLSGRYSPGRGERVAVVWCGADTTTVRFEG